MHDGATCDGAVRDGAQAGIRFLLRSSFQRLSTAELVKQESSSSLWLSRRDVDSSHCRSTLDTEGCPRPQENRSCQPEPFVFTVSSALLPSASTAPFSMPTPCPSGCHRT